MIVYPDRGGYVRKLFFLLITAIFVIQTGAAGESKDAKSKNAKTRPAVPAPIPSPEGTWSGFPRDGNIAAGIVIGTMSALTVQYWLTAEHTFDFGVEFRDHPWSVIYADYNFHWHRLFGKGTKFGRESSPYVGIGTGAGFWDRLDNCGRGNCTWTAGATGTGNGFFIRFPIGIDWYPNRSHIGMLAEFVPSFLWYPSNGQSYDIVLGAKYVF